MHFGACCIHCKVHWREGRRLGSYRLISAEVLCCLYWHSFNQIDHSTLWWALFGVNWLTSVESATGQRFGPVVVSPLHLGAFFILENELIDYANASTWIAFVPSPDIRVIVAESLSNGFVKVSEQCDIWGMKLNTSKTKTMIVSRSPTIHPQSPALTIEEVWWPCYIGSDISFQDDFWEASLLGFQSSFSMVRYLDEVLPRIPW